MQIPTAKERILVLQAIISREEAELLAKKKRAAAFGAISQVTSLFSSPKDSDFSLSYSEYRFEPLWHIVAHARYVYDRSRGYRVAVSEPIVTEVAIGDIAYPVSDGHFSFQTVEHCVQEDRIDKTIYGISGEVCHRAEPYTGTRMQEARGAVETGTPKGSILVPPTVRVSGIVRETVSGLIKGIQADSISEEQVGVDTIDLLYRPVYAFEYTWSAKNKKATIAVDGITGEVSTGQRTFAEYLGKTLDTNFLFDVGADAAGMFIPGGSIAVKVAKKMMETKRGR